MSVRRSLSVVARWMPAALPVLAILAAGPAPAQLLVQDEDKAAGPVSYLDKPAFVDPVPDPVSVLAGDWRPDANAVLAEIDGYAIDEQELFLRQAMLNADAEPLRGWRDAAPAQARYQLGIVRRMIEQRLEERVLADLPEASQGVDPEIAANAERVLVGPIARVVFADLVVRNQVEVLPLDIAYYYEQNKDFYAADEERGTAARSVREVAAGIEPVLWRKHLVTQTNAEGVKALEKSRARVRAEVLPTMIMDDMILVRVRDFLFTRGEFLTFHPEFATEPAATALAADVAAYDAERDYRVSNIAINEAILQFLEREAKANDPRLEVAREIARDWVAANNARRVLREAEATDDAAIDAQLDAEPELALPVEGFEVWRLDAKAERWPELDDAQRAAVVGAMIENITEVRETANRLIAERIDIQGAGVLRLPETIVTRLLDAEADRYSLELAPLSVMAADDLRDKHGIDAADLVLGELTEPQVSASGVVTAFYLGDKPTLPAPDKKAAREAARERLLELAVSDIVDQELNTRQREGRIVWMLPTVD